MAPENHQPGPKPTDLSDLADGHSALAHLAGRLLSHASGDRGEAPEEDIAHLLQETISTVTQHFLHEESLMKVFEYREQAPDRFRSHIESHADFSSEICRLICSAEIMHPAMLSRLGKMLHDFATHHQRDHDDAFVAHLLAGGQRA
ncbi:MAG: hypothetical protein H6945_11810 [Zoogloeaceae bacterium]|nr:hypothetical protein [Rhodocyclaceae bacterium]MCP5236410.1 hypothetical protein [Zoogloeaceae bacterium]